MCLPKAPKMPDMPEIPKPPEPAQQATYAPALSGMLQSRRRALLKGAKGAGFSGPSLQSGGGGGLYATGGGGGLG